VLTAVKYSKRNTIAKSTVATNADTKPTKKKTEYATYDTTTKTKKESIKPR
jgi:hypothetical protein